MKSIFNNNLLKYLTCIMILLNGVLFSLVATFYMDIAYFNKLSMYPSSALYIQLKTIPEEKADSTYKFLNEYAEQNGLFYIRKDFLLNRHGSVNGALFSIDGDIKSNKDKLTLDFLGQNITNSNKLEKLLVAKDENATLGVSETTLNSIDNIPRFKFGENIVFKKLSNTIRETKTINGEYRILGLDNSKKIEFLEGLSKVSGVDSSVFFDGKSGYFLDHGLNEIIIVGLFVISNLVLLSLLIVITIKYLPNLGKLILLGWSRKYFAIKLYQPLIYMALLSIFLFIPYGLVLTDITFNSIFFISLMLGIGILHFIIISILLLIASLFIFLISAINAVRERIPRRKYMIVAVLVYFIFNIFLIVGSVYIDSPYQEVQKNIEISKNWNKVSDYKILKNISVGNDQASFNRQSKEFFRDFYNWYKEISDDNDVNIINTSFISKDMLKKYKLNEVYKSVPNEEFWELTASPNYLKKIGIKIEDSVIENAKRGTRTYLIPENKSDNEIKLLKEMLIEKDTKNIRSDDIKTSFNENKEFEFLKYQFNQEVFSFSTKSVDKLMIKDPIILVITPENMIYRETESLIAIGLENSYIKLEGEAEAKYLSQEYLSKFNLNDNYIEFATIRLFVDGIQKDLWLTIQLFLGALIAITFIVIILLISIITIFQNAYKEKISVKKFLGYSNFSIYKIPLLLTTFVVTLDIITVILFHSKVGIVFMIVLGLIQLVIFYKVMISNQMKKLNLFLKS